MGASLSRTKTANGQFKVQSIDDDGKVNSHGIMTVSATELVFTCGDDTTYRWPLKYIRRYGCEDNLFQIEVGRKCTTGEGLYDFKCSKASMLFDMTSQAIGNLAEDDLSTHDQLEPQAPELQEHCSPKFDTSTPIYASVQPREATASPQQDDDGGYAIAWSFGVSPAIKTP